MGRGDYQESENNGYLFKGRRYLRRGRREILGFWHYSTSTPESWFGV